MAEALVSSILETLVAIAVETTRAELQLVTGVETEVKTLQKDFRAIQRVLEHAEEKQFADQHVKLWLDELKEVSYDMEDVLDEWSTALSKFKLRKDKAESSYLPKKLVSPCISCFGFGQQVAMRHDIGVKIREIKKELDEIVQRKDRFGFEERPIREPRLTTSFIDVSDILGRDMIRDDILMKLESRNTEGCIETISLVGMGGIGKTGLAQVVFDQVTRKNIFEKTKWICVSDVFDQTRIAREILEGLDDGTPPNSQMSLEGILCQIREKIRTSTFFFVFDDVWTERDKDWEALRAVLQCCQPGGRILVTTRKDLVATVMRSSEVIHLDLLPNEVCWNILKKVAFVGRENESRAFEDVGMEIAKKCKGLPLAAKTLGSLLRDKTTRVEWRDVLNSEFWQLDSIEEDIFKPLLLSYYDLPSAIKPCLLYCAIFPKDYNMSKEELILHWEAQGFLKSDKNRTTELKGEGYFNYLASRSFFQDFEKDDRGSIVECKVHDLIHDFLQFMTKDEIVGINVDSYEALALDSSLKKVRHLNISVGRDDTPTRFKNFLKSVNGVDKLRSLVIIGSYGDVESEALRDLLNNAKCLRLLELRGLNSDLHLRLEEVPKEIGDLIHLRYLGFHHIYNLSFLPESICELHNLQYFGLTRCVDIRKLPNEMEKLINLKYLVISKQVLDYLPKGIGKLTGLKRMDWIFARIDRNDPKEFSVGDLEKLDLLCGPIHLAMFGDTINREEAERAKLRKKTHLTGLRMSLNREGGKKVSGSKRDEIIEALKPPTGIPITWHGW